MSVNEPSPSPPRPPWYRRHLRRIAAAFIAAGLLIVLAQWVLLPWLLHDRIAAALSDAGVRDARFHVSRATLWGSKLTEVTAGDASVVHLDRVDLDYTLRDLWHGRLRAIRIAGATLKLNVRDGRIDLEPLRGLTTGSPSSRNKPSPTTTTTTLPVDRIELASSKLVLNTPHETIDVPLGGSVAQQNDGSISLSLQLDQERIAVIGGTVRGSTLTFAGAADPGHTLVIVRSIWPEAEVGVDGKLKLSGELNWGGKSTVGRAQLAITPDSAASEPAVSKDKLHLASGVFHVDADFASPTPLRVGLSEVALAMQGFTADGLAGEIALASFSPLSTPPGQKMSAAKLKIGELELTAGTVQFAMTASDAMHVEHTEWTCFDGRVWADGFVVNGSKPIAVTLHVQGAQLEKMLAEFAKDTASGHGKLSGQIPMVIDGSNVKFGEGSFAAFQAGDVQIKDAATLEATAAAAASSASGTASDQVKKNVVEALKDFQYDKLSARLANENGGLVGHVRMSGRGRAGAKQALAYDLNVTGLDDAIRAYVGIRSGDETAGRPSGDSSHDPAEHTKGRLEMTSRLIRIPIALAGGGLLLSACAHVTVDPIEVKEIHIVHDVNIHVDKELNDYFAFQEQNTASTQATTQPTTQAAGAPATRGETL